MEHEETIEAVETVETPSGKITCQICGAAVHAIHKHLDTHTGWSIERYRSEFPDAPLLSEAAKAKLAELQRARGVEEASEAASTDTRSPLHEVFRLGAVPAAMSPSGTPIPVTVLGAHDFQDMVPERDPNYVWNIDTLKTLCMCLELGLPGYTWGHMGSGKTTGWEQVCAATNRPAIRVNHTVNTEEPQIIGQWVVEGREMVYRPGWLPLALRHGWTYIADEYDFAVPHVLAAYQSVLEGKSLIIKDACEEWRVVKPHPNFRFVGTGNTNGVGDETGLYQGTQVQNAANYERFAVVLKVDYMDPKLEEVLLTTKVRMHPKDAKNLVQFASKIRDGVNKGELSLPISPRSLLNAAKLGMAKGDFRVGLELSYINRLSRIEAETARSLAQRIFG